MSKQKKRATALRIQRKRGQRKVQRKGALKAKRRGELANYMLDQLMGELRPQIDFWRCQVANYLHSDYSTGVWEPLFAGLYGSEGQIVSKEEACKVYALKYQGKPIQEISNSAKNVSHWLSIGESIVLESFTDAVKTLGEIIYEPKNSKVWEYVNERFGFEEYIKEKQGEDEVELIEGDDSEPLEAVEEIAVEAVEVVEESPASP